ncbi:MAG: type 4a pilus biogenesis protein PilO [Desulfobacterales bacterium]|nr:type 4a pilus biogenesis protein PilO [Desulfobacterales bacterium]
MAEVLDKIAKLPTPKKIMILIGILLLISGGYYYLFYMPKQTEISQLQSKLDQLQSDLIKKQTIARKLAKFKKEVAKLNEDFTIALVQLPNKKEVPALLYNVSRLGRETGLEFLLFKPMPEVKRDFYAEIPVDIKVLGKFHKIVAFFNRVSKLTRIVNITNLNVSITKISDTEDSLTVSCLATTFRFLEKEDKSETKNTKGK